MPDPLLSEPPQDIELWRKQSDIEKINDLKKYCMKGFPDTSLYDCYQKAIDLSEYFDCAVSILAIIHGQIPKDDSTLSKATRAFVTAVNTGLVKFWTAINQGAADLLRDCKYGEACAVTVPVPPRGIGEAGKDYPASPGTPGKGAAAEPAVVRLFIRFIEILGRHYSLLKERRPMLAGAAWADVLQSIVEDGKAFYLAYTGVPIEAENAPVGGDTAPVQPSDGELESDGLGKEQEEKKAGEEDKKLEPRKPRPPQLI